MLRKTSILLGATAITTALAIPALAHGPQGGWGGYGMMNPGMMGQGGYGMMSPGMMGQGGYGMMGPGMMGQGMMGQGGYGMMGQGWNCPLMGQQAAVDVTPDAVRDNLQAHLQMMGNDRLKVGEVTKQEDGTIVAEIITAKEGAVVERFAINPQTGQRGRID